VEDISKMADSIILLEERKEVTTFLLDEGTITETTVTTPTGETPGYEYSGVKVKVGVVTVVSVMVPSSNRKVVTSFLSSSKIIESAILDMSST